jgi:hypothetical protein
MIFDDDQLLIGEESCSEVAEALRKLERGPVRLDYPVWPD